MILQNIKSIISFIVGALLVFLLLKNCTGDRESGSVVTVGDKTVVVKLVTKLDTVYIKKYIHKIDTIKVPTLVKADTVFIEGKDVATIPRIKRTYKDVVTPVDSVEVNYTAEVTGTLDNITLEYKDRRAERTIIRTNTIEITNTIKPSGLYVGIGANLGLNQLTPAIEYLNNKNKFGIYYNVAAPTQGIHNVGLTYSRKLF